ncbi:MAG: 16S rRNA (adenine(1518)-N(6)/adenine(1519)-N(6))-dimethyltransferase RsmA [Flavobacteriales bacterium]
MQVRAKKSLGQHFLNNAEICQRIANSLTLHKSYKHVLEIGPGMGALTKFLLTKNEFETSVVEIDNESVAYLKKHFTALQDRIIEKDFLLLKLNEIFNEEFAVIGNFPYNISSQILFKALDYKEYVPELVGMFQKEVALRIASSEGSRESGILSVLLQAFYDTEYLFTVEAHEFTPPPKVKSGVIRMKRKENLVLDCDEKIFKTVVKTAFNQRRKTLRNSLKSLSNGEVDMSSKFFDKRPEQLSWKEFVELTKLFDLK